MQTVTPPGLEANGSPDGAFAASPSFRFFPENRRVLFQPQPPYVLECSTDHCCGAASTSLKCRPQTEIVSPVKATPAQQVFARPPSPQPPLKRIPLKSRHFPQHPAGTAKLQSHSPQERRHWIHQTLREVQSFEPTPAGELPMPERPPPFAHAAWGSSLKSVRTIRGFGATDVETSTSLGSRCGAKRDPAVEHAADADNGRTAVSVDSQKSSAADGVVFLLPSSTFPFKGSSYCDSGYNLLGNSLRPAGDDPTWRASHGREHSPGLSMPWETTAEEAADDHLQESSLTPARPTDSRAVATPGDSPLSSGAKPAWVLPRGRLPLLRLPQGATFESTFYSARDGTSLGVFHAAHGTGAPEGALLTARGEGGFYTARTDAVLPSARGVTESGTGGATLLAESLLGGGTGGAALPGEHALAAGTGCSASHLQQVRSANIAGVSSAAVENSGFVTPRSGEATPRTPRTWRETPTFSKVRTWVRKESSQACGSELDTYLADELDSLPPLPLTARSQGASSASSTAVTPNGPEEESRL